MLFNLFVGLFNLAVAILLINQKDHFPSWMIFLNVFFGALNIGVAIIGWIFP